MMPPFRLRPGRTVPSESLMHRKWLRQNRKKVIFLFLPVFLNSAVAGNGEGAIGKN
jgi:hypothetical protein